MADNVLAAFDTRIGALETAVEGLRAIEPTLRVFIDNIDFFRSVITNLEPRLGTLESAVVALDPDELSAVQDNIHSLRSELNSFRQEAQTQYATKNEVRSQRQIGNPVAPKGKMALPTPFSGKRDDWKVFSSHLTLYLTANASAYPTDSDKIVFAVSRLGEGSAFKYMMQFIPKLSDPEAVRPAIITSFTVFMNTMKETFGVQNANVVSETQLLQLQQKDSAVDYTNKFQELSSDLGWNDSALIAHYRRGLKINVVKAIDMLETVPTTFSAFMQKAIDVDTKQYASFLELRHRDRTSPANPIRSAPRPLTFRPPAPTPPPVSPAVAPSMAMDLTQARHLSPEEKKRRKDLGLCNYCGGEGHGYLKCPNKKTLANSEIAETSSSFDAFEFVLGNDEA
jgi:hypothetical protein